MIIKTKPLKSIIEFLNQNPIINLNIIGFLENEPDADIYVDNEESPTGVVARKGYFSYIFTENDEFLDEVLSTLYKNGFYGFSGVYRPLAQKIRSKFPILWESRCMLYYYGKDEIDLSLIKNPVQPVNFNDAETIDYYYTFRDDTSLQRIKLDIEKRDSSAVYVNGDIASWVLIHNDNSMGIMFTKEEYRKSGYAVDVTVDLTNKILKSGKVPFLQIIEQNHMSPGLAKKCGFTHDGIFSDWFGIIVGTPQEVIDMNDESRNQFIESIGDVSETLGLGNEQKLNCMYIFDKQNLESCEKPEDFKVEVIEGSHNLQKWCETLVNGLNLKANEIEYFIERVKQIVTNKKYDYKLFMGKIGDIPVSTVALLRLKEDACGIYFNTISSDKQKNEIEKATLAGAIIKAAEYDMGFFFIQSIEQKATFYKELGFIHSHIRNILT